jgi:hypothetical protein
MRKSDKRLIAILAVFCAAAWLALRGSAGKEQKILIVQKEQKVVQRIDLSKVTSERKLPLAVDDGQLVLQYDQEGARVLSSPCPDKVCIHQGKITRGGQTIACVPEKILITLTTNDKEKENANDAIVR